MAFRTWAKLLSTTLGVGALAGASQLGLAYGLGIVRLTRVIDVTARDQWTAQLAWIAWFPMTAAVAGALAGTACIRRWAPGFRGGPGTELAIAAAAALGAALVVPLTMQPARTAQVAGVDPVVVIAICAGLGALVGIFAAWAALAQAVTRWSLVTLGVAVWVVALVSVLPSLAPGDPLPAVRLGVLDAGFLASAVTQRTALATMPALALLAGAGLGGAARRRGLPTLTIALAGLPGPALLTLAYLIAGPGSGPDRYQVVPYWAAMTATGAGVLGSVLAAVLRRAAGPGDDDEDDAPAGKPTANRPSLPRRTSQQESAIAAAAAAHPAPAASAPEVSTPETSREPDSSSSAAPPAAARPSAAKPATAATKRAARKKPTATATASVPPPRSAPDAPLRAADTAIFDTPGDQQPATFDGFGRHAAADQSPAPRTAPAPRKPRAPEPTPVSRPLPQPTATSAPLPNPLPTVPPHPASAHPPESAAPDDPAPGGRSRNKSGLRRREDEEIADWVSGLGK